MSKKYMSILEFWETGYLHEINRCFLHPLGLALEVTVDSEGNYSLSGVWDARDDLDGISFSQPVAQKAIRIQEERLIRAPARIKELGYYVQPASDRDIELAEALIKVVHTAVDEYDADQKAKLEEVTRNLPPE